MDSFHAAIQISTPLTDSAWEVLKPRLIAQRELGEEREKARIAAEKAAEARLEEKKQEEARSKQAKENADRDWDEKQNPVRDLLTGFANEIIKNDWDDGKSVSKETCAKFAADVLLYVRKRFYDQISIEDEAAREAGEPIKEDPALGPPTRKLILENMKWVYDTRIKSLTEPFRKELFLCHDCDSNTKFYGFEGVIQHFAAKHTTLLSSGSIVVHWRAEWPEHSPFHPDPTSLKSAHHPQGQSHNSQQYGYSSYHSPGSAAAQPYSNGAVTSYHESYSRGPRPSSTYQDRQLGYSGSSSLGEFGQSDYRYGPSPGYYGQQNSYPAGAGYIDYPPHDQGPPHHSHEASRVDYGRPLPPGGRKYREPYPPYEAGPPPNEPHRPEAIDPVPVGIGPPVDRHAFKQHLEVMAAFAREIWTTVNSVKDIPTGVKFYVLIYHVVTRVKNRYGYEPSLEMFTEGVESQHLMRPIKHATGAVGCRTCVADARDPRYAQYGPRPSLERMYQLPSLLRHFKASHIDRPEQPMYGYPQLPDWKQDMVELPEEALVSALIHAPGMDDQKLRLLADAFPLSFANPLPRLGPSASTGSSVVPPAAAYNDPQGPSLGTLLSYSTSPAMPADVQNHREQELQHYNGIRYKSGSTGYDLGQSIDAKGLAYRDTRIQDIPPNALASDARLTQQQTSSNGARDMQDPSLGIDVTMEREPSYDPRHSDLVFAPKGTQPRPASRSNLGHKSREPHEMDEGSEDGEVGPISASANGITQNVPQIEGQSAADQFFQNYEKDNSQTNLVSSARNPSKANTASRSSWLKVHDTTDQNSRVSAESYDEYSRNYRDSRAGDGSFGHTPVYRERSWNENDAAVAAGAAPVREYDPDGRLPRISRGLVDGNRYAERPDQILAMSRSSQYQEYVVEPEAAPHDYGSRYRHEPSGHAQYSGQSRSPRPGSATRHGEAYQSRRHDQQSRSGRYGNDNRVGTSQTPASYVPEDLKHSLQIPASSTERAYVEDPRYGSTHRAEYVRVTPRPEDVRGGYVVGPPAERSASANYAHYEDTRGGPIYVERPAFQADVRLYEREDPRYESRRLRYG
jgi:hypothetical protein